MMSDRKKAEAYLTAKHLTDNCDTASQADIAKGVGLTLGILLSMAAREENYSDGPPMSVAHIEANRRWNDD